MPGKKSDAPAGAQIAAVPTGSSEAVLWFFSALWYGALIFFVRVGGLNALCMCSLMGLVGLLPLGMALASRRSRVRYGHSQLEMLAEATPGGTLEGVVHIPHALPADACLRLTLLCRRRSDADSADRVLWRGVELVAPLPCPEPGTGRIPVRVEIPATCLPSGPGTRAGSCYWTLQVMAERGGRGLDVAFEVPVGAAANAGAAER